MRQTKDETYEERAEILTRSLLTIIKLARQQSPPDLDQALDALQQKLSAEASSNTLESLMEPIKNKIICLQLGISDSGPDSNRDDSPASRDLADRLKHFYLEILGQMDVDLDGNFRDWVEKLRLEVLRAGDLDALMQKRPELENLVRHYAHSVFEERKRAAAFISEIASRLAELETHLAASVERIRKNLGEDDVFSRKLEKHVTETAASVLQAEKLEELKKMVISRLNTIGKVLRKKRRQDESRVENATSEFAEFQRRFGSTRQDVDKVDQENDRLLEKLKYDGLTGAFNRILYDEYLDKEMSRYKRYQRIFSIILFDLDHFKDVNDNFGHAIGDKCLKEVIGNIRPILRGNDILARYGGDEFVILLPETGEDQCSEVAEKIRQAIEKTDFTVRGKKLPLTISVGGAQVRDGDDCGARVFDRADQALYRAKKLGRNRVGVA